MVSLIPHIEHRLQTKIHSYTAVSGGDIHEAFKLETSAGSYFIKVNRIQSAKQMFLSEAKSLKTIGDTGIIRVPQVYDVNQIDDLAYLLMEFIDSQRPTASHFKTFGTQLAQLHQIDASQFGFDSDNFIGRLPQKNKKHPLWSDFYTHERLWPQLQLAESKGLLQKSEIPELQALVATIETLGTDIKPSLLHGDLWSGNFLIDTNDQAVLIDPALYFGDPVVDIAMSQLFGGFDPTFYDSYYAKSAAIEHLEPKIELYQLYYLLVHLNLFGRSYKPSVITILNRYF